MAMQEQFMFKLSSEDRQLLEGVATALERKPSDALRYLVRAEAKRCGLLDDTALTRKGQDDAIQQLTSAACLPAAV